MLQNVQLVENQTSYSVDFDLNVYIIMLFPVEFTGLFKCLLLVFMAIEFVE